MTVKIAAISLVVVAPTSQVQASEITAGTVISLANSARVSGGLGELKQNSLLSKAAQNKANDMLARQYFAHNTPTGETPWTFIKAVGYNYITAGENLAIDFTEAESIQTAWMNSPGHRANIMNGAFQEIGIGIAQGMYNGHQTTVVVQMFGAPIAQQVTLNETPTPVAKQVTAPAPTVASEQVTNTTPAPAKVAEVPAQQPAPQQPVTQTSETPKQDATANSAPSNFTAPIVDTTNVKPEATPFAKQPIEIKSTKTSLQGNELYLTVTASGDATKLLATYGSNAVMLDPSVNNEWHGSIPLSSLGSSANLIVYAYDMNGNLTHAPVAQFSNQINSSLKEVPAETKSVNVLGKIFNPHALSEKIILVILAGVLACLILTIAIKRHVQHVSLIANASFVAMLAAFMLMV